MVRGMNDVLDTVLLLALPASGKSEVRRYLAHLDPEQSRRDFHLGETVQLDDYPYVHLMRRIDDELAAFGRPRVFFLAADRPFRDARDWGTLIELVNEDHADLVARTKARAPSAGELLLRRFDAASERAGAPARFAAMAPPARAQLAAALEADARAQLEEKERGHVPLDGKTLVIEFARGGPEGSAMPLPAPLGYRHSLSQLSAPILERAAILYVWVAPEESRRKNQARATPDGQGSILHHGVPEAVMRGDYGCDDIDWLSANARRPGTVTVEAHGRTFDVPIARFDNRVDKTSFLRADRAAWRESDIRAVHDGLRVALTALAAAR